MRDQLKATMKSIEALPDDRIWFLAAFVVGLAGARAQKIGETEIEDACAQFCNSMYELVGTPSLDDADVN